MKTRLTFVVSLAAIFLTLSFTQHQTDYHSNLTTINTDTAIRVGVVFHDVPVQTAYCGIELIKVVYKFKLTPLSQAKVLSKKGEVKIEFSCPVETGKNFFLKDKVYYFYVVPAFKQDLLKDKVEEYLQSDGIPLYSYAGG